MHHVLSIVVATGVSIVFLTLAIYLVTRSIKRNKRRLLHLNNVKNITTHAGCGCATKRLDVNNK